MVDTKHEMGWLDTEVVCYKQGLGGLQMEVVGSKHGH